MSRMKPERNDPCPCGSGKKYKKCCGALTRQSTSGQTEIKLASLKDPRRECGTCTACCDGWVRMNIHGHDVFPGKPCPYSTGHSCSIYENRPEYPCRKFVCGWLEKDSPLPEEYRPDKIGVIFVIMEWRGTPIYTLTPAGRDPGEDVLAWAREWSARTQRPFLYQLNGEWYAFGPPEFRKEMLEKIGRGEKLW
mgnify:FL=1